MANFKRKRHKNARNFCKMCKMHKMNGAKNKIKDHEQADREAMAREVRDIDS